MWGTTGRFRGTRWFPPALGMTRGVQGWTSHLLEFTQVSAFTFHLLIHQKYKAVSEPSPWQSLEVFQPQPFHAAPTAALADARQGDCQKCQSTTGRDKGPHSTRRQLRTSAALGWVSSSSTDTCSQFWHSPVLIKVEIIIIHTLGFGSGTLYLCPLEEEVVSLGKCVSTSTRLGQTLTLGEGPEQKEDSAAGFAPYKPAKHTQPGFLTTCTILQQPASYPHKAGQGCWHFTAPACPAAFPQFWGCWTSLHPAKATLSPKRTHEKLYLTWLSCPLCRWVLP